MKMTIHRALAELKLIDSKIEKNISELNPVGLKQKDKLVLNYMKDDDFASQAQSSYDSVNDLISRKGRIKSAIVESNGVTTVKVGEKTMSVADAINMKSSMEFKKRLINQIKQSHGGAVAAMNRNNSIMEQNLQRILEATFGKESTKINASDLESVRTPYVSANETFLVDPLKVSDKIIALEKEVADFEMEVDAVLSESNAITTIEVA